MIYDRGLVKVQAGHGGDRTLCRSQQLKLTSDMVHLCLGLSDTIVEEKEFSFCSSQACWIDANNRTSL